MKTSASRIGYWFRIVFCAVTLLHLSLVHLPAQERIDTLYVERLLTKSASFINSHPDSLLIYTLRGLEAAESLHYERGIMRAQKIKGVYHWLRQELDSAMDAYEHSLEHSVRLSDEKSKNELFLNMGMVFSKLGDYSHAIELLLKAARGSDSIGNNSNLARAYNSLAVAYLNMNNLTQAKYFIQQGIELFILQGDSVDLAGAYSNLGNIFKEEGNLIESKKLHEQALEIFTRENVPRGIVTALNNLSNLYLSEKEPEQARAYLNKSIEISRNYGFKQNEMIALIGLAETDYLLGDFNKSRLTYLQVLHKIYESGQITQLSKVYMGLGELLIEMGNYKEAADYLMLNAHLTDSLSDEELTNAVTNTRIAYEIKKRKNETELLAKNLEIAELRSRNTQILAGSIVGSLLVLIAFLIFYSKRRRQLLDQRIEQAKADFEISQLRIENQQLKEIELRSELETRNRELSTYTLNLLQKNELLNEIRKELKGLNVSDAKAKSSISRILSTSSLSSYQDKEWDLFKQYFDNAYGGFFDKLSYLNSDLTPYDKRLAALTRLELTGEQIASIMGISVSSVKVSRHRLRKKLNVLDSVALGNFLIELDSNQSLGLTDFTHIIDLIGRNLVGVATREEAYWTVARNCIQYLRLEDIVIYEVNRKERILKQCAAYNFDGDHRIQGSCNFQLPLDSGICGYVGRTGETVRVGDTTLDTRYVIGEMVRYSELAVPILLEGEFVGVIDSEHSEKYFFTKNHAVAMEKIADILSRKIQDLSSGGVKVMCDTSALVHGG